jgi:hypothetical protein
MAAFLHAAGEYMPILLLLWVISKEREAWKHILTSIHPCLAGAKRARNVLISNGRT